MLLSLWGALLEKLLNFWLSSRPPSTPKRTIG
jgi:hypothetical protein